MIISFNFIELNIGFMLLGMIELIRKLRLREVVSLVKEFCSYISMLF